MTTMPVSHQIRKKNKTEKEEETVVKSVNTDFDKKENSRVASLWGKHIWPISEGCRK